MGGAKAVKRLHKIAPDVKAMVSSGDSDDGPLANYRTQGFGAFLKKSYSIKELRETIRKLTA